MNFFASVLLSRIYFLNLVIYLVVFGDITWKLSKHNLVISAGWCLYKRPRLDTQYGVR